jgi:hypothetical protein
VELRDLEYITSLPNIGGGFFMYLSKNILRYIK